ncbi:hypothetical protein [Sphingobium fuliginis]|uniref:hypothetical protein n=1 Tax=Sphingobium fuliginis (strain ATCC 27551) TaxID=336203 RepID=UPI0020C77BAB|nr:hypothetical protein [Sphingobium fuliginis]
MAALPDAQAQDMDASDPLQGEPAALFEPTPLALGSATVRIGGSARLEYDSNIYAQPLARRTISAFRSAPMSTCCARAAHWS